MLPVRIAETQNGVARLSFAVRARTSRDKWFLITSLNLGDLLKEPLPSVEQQVQRLIEWIGGRVGDDRFGKVHIDFFEQLCGEVGATDREGVVQLIQYSERKGVLNFDEPMSLLSLSPEGWAMIESDLDRQPTESVDKSAAEPDQVAWAHCNNCGGDKKSFVRSSYEVSGRDGELAWSNTIEILECCGCEGLSVRKLHWFSEWDYIDDDPNTGAIRMVPGIKTTYWPSVSKRKQPSWIDQIGDEALRNVLRETYTALDAGILVLATIGTRTALDRAMYLLVGDPSGGFAGKLKRMVEEGHIGESEKTTLLAMTDAGSAAAHRGYGPSPDALTTILDAVENFLHREFVLKKAAVEVKKKIPPRQKSAAQKAKSQKTKK